MSKAVCENSIVSSEDRARSSAQTRARKIPFHRRSTRACRNEDRGPPPKVILVELGG